MTTVVSTEAIPCKESRPWPPRMQFLAWHEGRHIAGCISLQGMTIKQMNGSGFVVQASKFGLQFFNLES
jgi:hypothetical protein